MLRVEGAVYYFFVEIVMGYWCGCVFSFQEDRNNSLYDRYACKNAVRKCKWVPLKYLFQTAIYHLNKESNITNIINKYSKRCWIKWANIYQVLLFAIYTYTYLYGNTYLNSCLYISYCCCCCVCLIWVAVNWFYHFTFRLQCALHMYIFYFMLAILQFNSNRTNYIPTFSSIFHTIDLNFHRANNRISLHLFYCGQVQNMTSVLNKSPNTILSSLHHFLVFWTCTIKHPKTNLAIRK